MTLQGFWNVYHEFQRPEGPRRVRCLEPSVHGRPRDRSDPTRASSAVQYRKGGKSAKSQTKGRNKSSASNRAVPIIAHENERVIPANKRKRVERLMKRDGMRLTNRKRGRKSKRR